MITITALTTRTCLLICVWELLLTCRTDEAYVATLRLAGKNMLRREILLWKWYHLKRQYHQRDPIISEQFQKQYKAHKRGSENPQLTYCLITTKKLLVKGLGKLLSLTCSLNLLAVFKFLAQVLDLKFSQPIRSVLKIMTVEGSRPNDLKR